MLIHLFVLINLFASEIQQLGQATAQPPTPRWGPQHKMGVVTNNLHSTIQITSVSNCKYIKHIKNIYTLSIEMSMNVHSLLKIENFMNKLTGDHSK